MTLAFILVLSQFSIMANAYQPRKTDPNRFKSVVQMPEGAAKDPDYLRAIQDLEDQQSNRAGWLFAKGAFDKGDLLHLRDEEEKRRHVEREMLAAEHAEFLRQRAALEQSETDTMGRQASPGTAEGFHTRPRPDMGGPPPEPKRKKLLPVVRMKPAAEAQTGKESSARPQKEPNADQKSDADKQDKSETKRQGTDLKIAERNTAEEEKEEHSKEASGLGSLLGAYESDEESS